MAVEEGNTDYYYYLNTGASNIFEGEIIAPTKSYKVKNHHANLHSEDIRSRKCRPTKEKETIDLLFISSYIPSPFKKGSSNEFKKMQTRRNIQPT